MKRVKLLIVSLAITTLANADPYLKFSAGYLEPLSEGSLEQDLDSSWIPSLELGTSLKQHPDWSIGLEYSHFDTEYSLSGNLSTSEADAINDLFADFGVLSSFNAGATSVKEEIEAHRLLFVLNYEHELNDQLRFLLTGGIGLSMVDQKISISNPGVNASEKDDDTAYAYQIGAGLGYDFNETFSLSGRARLLGADELPFESDKQNYLAFELSAKYTF